MTHANVVTFFAESRWGSRYGDVDAYHRTSHKGLDCGLFKGIVDVPALHAGEVVAAAASTSVGHYVTIERADGLFDTYGHTVLDVKVGQTVREGDPLGRQAITQLEGGKDWRGQHTHLCLSRTRDGWAVWGYVNLDPTPGVIAALTTAASDNATPLDTEEEMTTRVFQMLGKDGETRLNDWSRIGPDAKDGCEKTADISVARSWIYYDTGTAAPIPLPRDQYIALQKFAAQEHLRLAGK